MISLRSIELQPQKGSKILLLVRAVVKLVWAMPSVAKFSEAKKGRPIKRKT
jgi:hypothetical protein